MSNEKNNEIINNLKNEIINKITINENIKEDSENKKIKEKNEFTNPDHKLNWNYLDQKSYHLKQDIERVWSIVKNYDILSLISNKENYPIVYIKGQDSWKLGNEFKGNICGIYPFVAKVNKCINLPEIRKIEWILNLINNDYILLKLELFKVTNDNSTVVLKKIKYEKEYLFSSIVEIMSKNEATMFQKVEQILDSEPINLLQYESGVINGQMKDIWDIITDFNKLTAIAPNNNFLPNINIRKMKIGEKAVASIIVNEKIKEFDIYLRIKDERPGWNKWIIILEIFVRKELDHSLLIQLTKINNNECQFTIITKFHKPLKADKFREISVREKYLIISVKDFFNNFYSPNS